MSLTETILSPVFALINWASWVYVFKPWIVNVHKLFYSNYLEMIPYKGPYSSQGRIREMEKGFILTFIFTLEKTFMIWSRLSTFLPFFLCFQGHTNEKLLYIDTHQHFAQFVFKPKQNFRYSYLKKNISPSQTSEKWNQQRYFNMRFLVSMQQNNETQKYLKSDRWKRTPFKKIFFLKINKPTKSHT